MLFFLFVVDCYSTEWTYHSLAIHSPAYERLHNFRLWVLQVKSSASKCTYLGGHTCLSFLRKHLGVEWLNYRGGVCLLFFLRPNILSRWLDEQLCILTGSECLLVGTGITEGFLGCSNIQLSLRTTTRNSKTFAVEVGPGSEHHNTVWVQIPVSPLAARRT